MKAVIMAGGLGTRLRPLTCQVPKPMVPVMNRPILEHTISLLHKHNFNEIIILLYYLPEVIRNYFNDGSKFDVRINYITAKQDFGTAGAVRQAAEIIEERFLVISGDAITDLDLSNLKNFHIERKALATIAVTSVSNPAPYGIAITDKDSRITRFLEKPAWSQIFSDTVNMGIYCLEPQIFDYIPTHKEFYFAKDVFPKLVSEGKEIFGYTSGCYWKDIGDLRTYQQVHWDIVNGKLNLDVNSKICNDNVCLGENCDIESDVRLENAVIGDNCKIKTGTSVINSIIWQGVEIGKNCELSHDVIASYSSIGDNTIISDNVYISNEARIGSGCYINSNIKIWPQKVVNNSSIVNSSIVWGDKWQRELFSDSRVSGLTNYEITPEFAAKLGASFGTWLGKGGNVLLGRDASHASRMIYRSLITGLMSAGVNVNTVQVLPIPLVRYALWSSIQKGGVFIRRSPYDRNVIDILFFDNAGRDLSSNMTKAIERVFYREDIPRVNIDEVGKIEYPIRVTDFYRTDFWENIDVKAINAAKYKIVVDYSHGSATQTFPSILGALDCDVISLNAFLDQNKSSNTSEEFCAELNQLANIVRSTQSHAGFIIDAGAEKIMAVDDKGNIIPGERLAVLITKLYIQTHKPQKIAIQICAPMQIENMAKENNIELVYTPDDDGALIKTTEDPDLSFAVEIRGGFIFTDFHFAFDGMFALVKILELLAKNNISLYELNQSLPYRSFKNIMVPCPWESKGKVMRKMTEYSEGRKRVLIDGIKLLLNDEWVLVLPDREQPVCHIMAEAGSEERSRELVNEYQNHVLEWIRG